MTSKKIVVGNWKMNPDTVEEALRIVRNLKRATTHIRRTGVVICPPFPYLFPLAVRLEKSRISLGVQDIFEEPQGAHTGATSVRMVMSLGARYVIVGHSERRAKGDSNEIVAKKLALALHHGLTPILCIGEKDHDGQGNYLSEIQHELHASLGGLQKKQLHTILIAYEPIWAIGKPDESAMKPDELEAMAIFIRKTLTDTYGDEGREIPILYGGAVSSGNAELLVHRGNVDGLLVGHESLIPEEFSAILRAVEGV